MSTKESPRHEKCRCVFVVGGGGWGRPIVSPRYSWKITDGKKWMETKTKETEKMVSQFIMDTKPLGRSFLGARCQSTTLQGCQKNCVVQSR